MKPTDWVDLFSRGVFIIVAILAVILVYEALVPAASTLWDAQDSTTLQDQVRGMIEAELVELTLAVLIVFGIGASLFSSWFENRTQERFKLFEQETEALILEKVQAELNANKKEAYHAASANYYHELAYDAFVSCGDLVNLVFDAREIFPLPMNYLSEMDKAHEAVRVGLHHTNRGLECIRLYDATKDDFFRHRRVPWQLKNSRLWFLGAEILLLGDARMRCQYDEPLQFIDELHAFVTSGAEPKPTWYNTYESSAFFLLQLHRFFPDEGFYERGRELIQNAISGKTPKTGLPVPPAEWINEVTEQYRKAGLI